ncbi:MAG: HPr(Ser) kinase/phosphatase [Oscillospiraceae bacterium]|nr:HPr(Ser) kinase/phosphatase [Oscillospiraceae bacterium]
MQQPSFHIQLSKIVENFNMEVVHRAEDFDTIRVETAELNRPGLQLVGFYDYFSPARLQILGMVETTFLKTLSATARKEVFTRLFATKIPALILCRDEASVPVCPECVEAAVEQGITILRTDRETSDFMAACIAFLNIELAPRMTRHGVLVEVYGEGILLFGESGVGKSEAAIELVKRGHRLIADDAVELRRTSDTALVGTAPESIRHYIELRGLGIIDVRRLFGIGAVKISEKVDLVIQLEIWKDDTVYDRLGIDQNTMELLGINVPCLTVPVRPGRNLAAIIEVAAMNNRQKRMGYNSAIEFTKQLNQYFEANAASLD